MGEAVIQIRETNVLNNASFHPCVRLPKFHRDKVLSFIPPDGNFMLGNYWHPLDSKTDRAVGLPFHFKGGILYHSDTAKLDLEVQPRLSITKQNQVSIENFAVAVRIPDSISSVFFES